MRLDASVQQYLAGLLDAADLRARIRHRQYRPEHLEVFGDQLGVVVHSILFGAGRREDWGLGQVQSVTGRKVTVNFQDAGKQVIDTSVAPLSFVSNDPRSARR